MNWNIWYLNFLWKSSYYNRASVSCIGFSILMEWHLVGTGEVILVKREDGMGAIAMGGRSRVCVAVGVCFVLRVVLGLAKRWRIGLLVCGGCHVVFFCGGRRGWAWEAEHCGLSASLLIGGYTCATLQDLRPGFDCCL